MKLSQKYSQFENKNLLLIVAGKQDAVLYHSKNGIIDKILSFAIPKPEYSDNEGIFQKSVHGRVQSGSVEIRKDETMVRDFLHELGKRTKEIQDDFSEIYVFAPAQTKNRIGTALPKAWKKKINKIMEGNYFNKAPTFLFEKIAKNQEKPFTARKSVEEKILKKAEHAQNR